MNGQLVGVVAIGKNEGDRLKRALRAIQAQNLPMVYVDSGSTDGSVLFAREIGCDVVDLDMRTAFTAARARNEGFFRLLSNSPQLHFVQFIDGDCELAPGWIPAALAKMEENSRIAATGGRCRERHPEASIYNQLIDAEWDTPVGPAQSCGGNALIRVESFREIGGFDESFAAGEEPELCFRLRKQGWTIFRLPEEMVKHDADITSWKQWWLRSKRSGVAYAQGAWVHGRSDERYNVKHCARIWFWAGAVPTGAIVLGPLTSWMSLVAALGGYGVLLARMIRFRKGQGDTTQEAMIFSLFNLMAKFPQLQGQIEFLIRRKSSVIDHRSAGRSKPIEQ